MERKKESDERTNGRKARQISDRTLKASQYASLPTIRLLHRTHSRQVDHYLKLNTFSKINSVVHRKIAAIELP